MKNLFLAVALLFLIPSSSFSLQTLYINQGKHRPIPIAVNKFAIDSIYEQKLLDNISSVIENNLRICGAFHLISKSGFIENKIGIQHQPFFAAWRSINASALLNGYIKRKDSVHLEVNIILWDIVAQRSVLAKVYTIHQDDWRSVAHKISDEVYQSLTGAAGYFTTKIAYVAREYVKNRFVKRIAIIDQDGANNQFITDGRKIVLTPKFSPKGDKLLYVSYARNIPQIYLKDFNTNITTLIGGFPGMSFAGRFSPDGNNIIMSLARGGATNIVKVNLCNKTVDKLTNTISINTSPSYSPDSKFIYFNSNRDGTRQLYVMDHDGLNVRRISFGQGIYASPVCSPDGRRIAFTKIIKGKGFSIGVMDPDGSNERIITTGYLVEGQSWSSNSKFLTFAKTVVKNKRSEVRTHIININTLHQYQLSTPYDALDPDWSTNRY